MESTIKGEVAKLESRTQGVESTIKGEVTKLEGRIQGVEAKIDTSIARLETSLAARIYTAGLVQFIALLGSLVALLKFFDLR